MVDDNLTLREMITTYLSEINPEYEIVGYSGKGQDALKECRELDPDLVILDLHLPDTDGLEILRIFKSSMPHIKILIFSGIFEGETVEKALKLKADGYIKKTSGFVEITKAIQALTSGDTYFNIEVEFSPKL